MEEANKSIKDELRELKEVISEKSSKKKEKKVFNLPFKARLNNSRLRKGYTTVIVINDNMAIDFRKEPIIDGTIKLDDTYHAIEEYDIFNYKGKPLIFQPKCKLNPYNPLQGERETYGQKYIMSRMEGERIISKKQIGWGLSIGVLIIIGVIVYALWTGG